MPAHATPADAVQRAVALLLGGATAEQAADAAGVTRSGLLRMRDRLPALDSALTTAIQIRETQRQQRNAEAEARRQARQQELAAKRAAKASPKPASTPAPAALQRLKAPRDTRPTVKPEQVLGVLRAMAGAGTQARFFRWAGDESWGPLRSMFHRLPDAVRRECIVRLVLEEHARAEHDDGASMAEHGRIGFGRRRDD